MFSADEARNKKQFATKARQLSFDEALKAIEDEIIDNSSACLSHITMKLPVDRATAKQLKEELKESGYHGIGFYEYLFGYLITCSW